jgi:hypothetical protein
MAKKSSQRSPFQSIFDSYLNALFELARRGDAREESHYPALNDLLNTLARAQGRNIQVTVLPKPTEAGNPDFRVWDGSYQVIGYIEAKAPGANLDQVEASEQLQRYLHTFPNLILTDFYEFRLYRNGKLLERVLLARPFVAQQLKAKPPAEQVEELTHLFETFFSFVLLPSLTAEDLARELARRTRFLRDQVILPELKGQVAAQQSPLYGFYEAFQKYLIAGLTEEQFADLYAQTITYGLFAARTRTQDVQPSSSLCAHPGYHRHPARCLSIHLARQALAPDGSHRGRHRRCAERRQCSGHPDAVLSQGKGDDPILHFYETFLAEYDPETRERRGVYYTPQPVVRYIVRAVHDLLKTRFGLPDGLADPRVTLLDPAAGTLTFPAEAIQLAFQEFTGKYGAGRKGKPPAQPYPAALLRLRVAHGALCHWPHENRLPAGVAGRPAERRRALPVLPDQRAGMEDLQTDPPSPAWRRFRRRAIRLPGQENEPILVILGNPPYSGHTANKGLWEKELKRDLDGAQSYYTVDGQPLREKNPKWLQDDYVKFLRFAQWKIHKAGRGIVAMITNHGYLDNPTFRGMRQSLLKTFDEIYILDLHGNSLKRETAPDGGPDENVFDIRQGVAIAIFVKYGESAATKNLSSARVYHADLYGKREDKYAWLDTHDLSTAGYQPITPVSPYYFFTPRQTQNLQAYQSWPSVTEIFPVNSVGIVTARDGFAIAFDKTELQNRVLQFQNTQGLSDDVLAQAYDLKDKPGWSLNAARKKVQADSNALNKIHPILYRPFDVRYVFYHEAVIERPRPEVMRHMLAGENLGLLLPRRVEHVGTWQHAFITPHITEHVAVSLKTIDYLFPLYLYPSAESPDAFHQERKPNLANWLLPELSAAYGFTPTPEEVLAYIYAVLYSPTYRQKYAQELRTDFPRVPFTADADLFSQMAALGWQLIACTSCATLPTRPGSSIRVRAAMWWRRCAMTQPPGGCTSTPTNTSRASLQRCGSTESAATRC